MTRTCCNCPAKIPGQQRLRIAYVMHDLTGQHPTSTYTHDRDVCTSCAPHVARKLTPDSVVHAAWELIAGGRWTVLQGIVK